MAVTHRDYSADLVEAARSVLLELVGLLGEYRDDIVVVGGWVPQLILPQTPKLLDRVWTFFGPRVVMIATGITATRGRNWRGV